MEHQRLKVKGRGEVDIELRYTIHGPVLYEDRAKNVAYALKWVGADPGGAGYMAALGLMRARNWEQFRQGVERYLMPSENLVYADRSGNIGWVAGRARRPSAGTGADCCRCRGDTGEYEWSGYLPLSEHPQKYNPANHYIATANHNILPEGYTRQLSFEWGAARSASSASAKYSNRAGKWTVEDFEHLQQDTTSLPARRLQGGAQEVAGAGWSGWRPRPANWWSGMASYARIRTHHCSMRLVHVAFCRAPLFGSDNSARPVNLDYHAESSRRRWRGQGAHRIAYLGAR